ncbi:MAG TPA: radical SAM protein [Candidatus Marinimicrobia bacterium]|nr:radical SAM protein [Candidatus Neomarinimicrobiota bacterium]
MNNIKPLLVYSDGNGQVFNHEHLWALGSSAERIVEIQPEMWIPLPFGSQLLELPGRLPVGKQPETGEIEILEGDDGEGVVAVAAFVAPAYTVCYHAAYECLPEAPLLPLYAYSAVGWYAGRFYVPAIRIDESIRQDPSQFNGERIKKAARQQLKKYPHNRLADHLVNNCAMTYGCPAALNFLLNRWELPLPTSQSCNADCLGCISLQKDTGVCSAQFRISFIPTAAEITEIAVDHLETAPEPVASFGQGCEGEPLMNAQLLIDVVKGIRQRTPKGTINLNTNASRPDVVAALRNAGLDSMRVSLNSARELFYQRYFRPKGYRFADVLAAIEAMKSRGGFVSLNLFVFPGFTDQPAEIEALENLIEHYQIDMIQWRNLNMDPEWYWATLKPEEQAGIGILETINRMRDKFPALRHGYFNPCLVDLKNSGI